MNNILFWISLWAGKLFVWIFKHIGRERSDRPGMLSLKIYLKFIDKVAKPKLTICVSGTNGKTSISLLLADIFRKQGYKVANNDWGANANAGHARLFLDAVDIFNRSTKDVAIVETDELLSSFGVPQIKPDYFIINNLGRDSMFSNGNPEYVSDHLKRAIKGSLKTKLVINADDPLCHYFAEGRECVYFGVSDQKTIQKEHVIEDFTVCPNCLHKPMYNYRNYRHIGDYYCPNCGLKAHERDYLAKDIKNNSFVVKEKDKEHTYPIVANSLHNIYNTTAIIALLRDIGLSPEKIAEYLSGIKVVKSRETSKVVKGINIYSRASKTQNPAATSTVLESIVEEPGTKELIIMYDEFLDDGHFETVSWIYDTDYDNFKHPSIKKIIFIGDRYFDHKLRLLLAGVDQEKMVFLPNEKDVINYVDVYDVDSIYIVHDIVPSALTIEKNIFKQIETKILEGGKKHES